MTLEQKLKWLEQNEYADAYGHRAIQALRKAIEQRDENISYEYFDNSDIVEWNKQLLEILEGK